MSRMDFTPLLTQRFNDSIQVKRDTLSVLAQPINQAAELLLSTLQNQKKILICGNGGSAADAQHFAAELIMRYETLRPSLPAIALTTDSSALTAIGNDLNFQSVFSRQVSGLGQAGDLLIAISTSGNSENVCQAVKTAHENKMNILVLSGGSGGTLHDMLTENDVEVCIPSNVTGRIQETHILIIHFLCEVTDKNFT